MYFLVRNLRSGARGGGSPFEGEEVFGSLMHDLEHDVEDDADDRARVAVKACRQRGARVGAL